MRRQLSAPVAGAACAAIALAALARNRAFFHDDAFITLRYARNLAGGLGPVWNPGEAVEGYTNFLHLVLTSGLGMAGLDLLTAARLVSFASWALLVAWLAREGRSVDPGPAGLVPAIVTATSFPLLVWILGGLETPLFAALLTACAWLAAKAISSQAGRGRDPGEAAGTSEFTGAALASGIAGALAAMTRPEGLLVAALAGSGLLVKAAGTRRWRPVLLFAAGLAALLGPYLAWRVWYYGDPLPNTFYVKGTGGGLDRIEDGVRYALGFAFSPPFVVPLAAGACLAAARLFRKGPHDARLVLLGAIAACFTAWVVLVGGDHMPAWRFLAPIVPLLGLLLLLVLQQARAAGWTRLPAIVPVLLILLAPLQLLPHTLNPVKADPAAWKGGVVGRWIEGHWPAGSLVALNTAGTTPYYARDLRFIDMLGLNDRTIAHRKMPPVRTAWQRVPGHAKGDGAYVLGRRPDFIIPGPAEGTTLDDEPWFLSDAEMAERHDEVDRDYALETVQIDVSREPGYLDYLASAAGTMKFTYYRRRPA